MRNLRSGKWRRLLRVGLCIASLSCLLWVEKASAFERKNWIFSQLAQAPLPTLKPRAGLQVGISTLTYDSYSSTQGSFFWDLKFLEVGAKISGRLLGSLGVGRTAANNQLQNWQETYSVELARRFMSPDGRFGRLGIEYDEFSPTRERFVHVAIDTGILDSPNELGVLKLSIHWFRPLRKTADTRLTTQLDTGFALSQEEERVLRLGLALGWSYQLTQEQDLAFVQTISDKRILSEHMFFSWSPWVEYASAHFIARVAVPLRLFMDKSWQAKSVGGSDSLVVSYPFAWKGPDIAASLNILF